MSFVLNSIVIFLIVMYFTFFIYFGYKIIRYIDNRAKVKLLIVKKSISLNFSKWRDRTYSFYSSVYDGFLIYGHIIVDILIILLACTNFSIFNIIILISALGFIYIMDFKMSWPY